CAACSTVRSPQRRCAGRRTTGCPATRCCSGGTTGRASSPAPPGTGARVTTWPPARSSWSSAPTSPPAGTSTVAEPGVGALALLPTRRQRQVGNLVPMGAFTTPDDVPGVTELLSDTGYVCDESLATVVFLAMRMQ